MRLYHLLAIPGIWLAMLLCGGSAHAAGTCPQCPSGCVPEISVIQQIPSLSSDIIRICPEGCVPVETVKTYKMPPPCLTVADKTAEEPPKPVFRRRPSAALLLPPGNQPLPPDPKDSGPPQITPVSVHDISRGQILLGPVVMEKVPRQLSLAAHGLQVVEMQYSPNRYFQMGLAMMLPILGVGGMATLRLNRNLSEHDGIGIGIFGGGLQPVGSLVTKCGWWFAGLHTGVSFATSDGLILNIGLIVAMVGRDGDEDGFRYDRPDAGIVPVPYLGLLVPVTSRWSFVGELFFPVTDLGDGDDSNYHESSGEGFSFDFHINFDLDLEYENPFMLYYGFRFSEKRVFGDLGFFIPMQPELIKMLMYCPPGLPYISVGFRF